MKRQIIYMVLLLTIAFSCNQRSEKLTANYSEIERSLEMSVELLYREKIMTYWELQGLPKSDSMSEHSKKLSKLVKAEGENLEFFKKYENRIKVVRSKDLNKEERTNFMRSTFYSYRDTLVKFLIEYDTIAYNVSERISQFKKKWNEDFSYLNSVEDTSIFYMNLAKLKFDLLLMSNDASSIYFSSWCIDLPVYGPLEILIIDDTVIKKGENYNANLIMGVPITQHASEIMIKKMSVNGKIKPINCKIEVNDISEIKLEASEIGTYKYFGYLKYMVPDGSYRYYPFERGFVVE